MEHENNLDKIAAEIEKEFDNHFLIGSHRGKNKYFMSLDGINIKLKNLLINAMIEEKKLFEIMQQAVEIMEKRNQNTQ